MSLRVQVDDGDIHVRVCPGCLHPLEWYEYREAHRAGLYRVQTQKTEERARCPNHGWVDWWRILHVSKDSFSGFSTISRGGRLHKRLVPRARVLAHVRRRLVGWTTKEARARLRNRFRGVAVRDVRQATLFDLGDEP